MAYKTIIFDFFDVIHEDPLELWLKKHGHKREGIITEACAALDVGKLTLQSYLARLGLLSGQTVADVKKEFETASIKTDTVQVLHNLKERYPLGLLTNTTGEEVNPLLHRHGLRALFNEVIISAEVGLAKPNPQIFQLMLERLGANPNETIFVDNNLINVAAAQSIGITGVHFTECGVLQRQLGAYGVMTSAEFE